MENNKLEMMTRLKELKELCSKVESNLEKDGLGITNLNKEQLFRYNLRNIIISTEALLRNEPSEKPVIRLKKEIPDAYENIKKLVLTKAGKNNSDDLNKIRELASFIELNFQRV